MIVERATVGFKDPVVHVGQLFVTLRLTGAAPAGPDGWNLLADAGDGDVHHLVDADYSTSRGHCYAYQSTARFPASVEGHAVGLRIWIGDGHGGARLVTRRVTVPRPKPRRQDADPDPRASPTWKLGCYSPHM